MSTWTKTIVTNAKSTDNDISINFFVKESKLIASIQIDSNDNTENIELNVKDLNSITNNQYNVLISLLKLLRDTALTDLGYIQT